MDSALGNIMFFGLPYLCFGLIWLTLIRPHSWYQKKHRTLAGLLPLLLLLLTWTLAPLVPYSLFGSMPMKIVMIGSASIAIFLSALVYKSAS